MSISNFLILAFCFILLLSAGSIIFCKKIITMVYALFVSISVAGIVLLMSAHSFLAISLFLFSILALVVINSFSNMLSELENQEKKPTALNVLMGLIVGAMVSGSLIYCLILQETGASLLSDAGIKAESEIQQLGMQFMENNTLVLEFAGICFLQLLVGSLLFLRKVKNEN